MYIFSIANVCVDSRRHPSAALIMDDGPLTPRITPLTKKRTSEFGPACLAAAAVRRVQILITCPTRRPPLDRSNPHDIYTYCNKLPQRGEGWTYYQSNCWRVRIRRLTAGFQMEISSAILELLWPLNRTRLLLKKIFWDFEAL